MDKHRHTPRIGVLRHLRLAELGVLIYQVQRILVCRRLQRQHKILASLCKVTTHNNSLRIKGIDKECNCLTYLFAYLLNKLNGEIIVIACRLDDVVDVYALATVVHLA